MRSPFPEDFPRVFVHSAWQGPADRILPDHPGYFPAKKRRDFQSALRICDEFCQEDVLELIYDACHSTDSNAPAPVVVSPALTLHETQNVLAITYGRWLAKEMGWSHDQNIYQIRTLSRDFTTSGWFRLVQQPQFAGAVTPGQRYIIADDVCTMGGTIACLRAHIEGNGGQVICATTLANRDGHHDPISLAPGTLSRLTTHIGGRLVAACPTELGYDLASLTEPEGQFLLRCSSYDSFRAGVDGARDP